MPSTMWVQTLVCAITLAVTAQAQQKYANNGTHWIVLPDKIIAGKALPITFNFYNTTEDIVVQVELLQYDHVSIASVTHTFANAQPGMLNVPVPDVLHHSGTYYLLVNGIKGVYFQQHGALTHDLGYIPKRFAVHVQLDKAIYQPGQTIQFRTFGVYSDMAVFTGRFDVVITDPKNNIMKQMTNVTSGAYGVLEDSMLMDEEPILGQWRIIVNAHAHYYDNSYYGDKNAHKFFTIDKYVLPKFSVSLNLPSYVVTTDNQMTGTVVAKYTYGKPVLGTVLIRADINYPGSPWKYEGDEVMVETKLDLQGDATFTIPFDQITHEVDPNSYEPLVEKLAGYSLIITASVTESLNNLTRNSTSMVQFFKEPYRVTIASSSPAIFKPGLPYVGHISIQQADGLPVISSTQDVLLRSYVKFFDTKHGKYRAQTLPDQHFAPPPTGILDFTVDPPEEAYSLHLEVEYKGLTAEYNMAKPYWLIEKGNLQLKQTTGSVIGSIVDFELLAALPMQSVFYSVVTNAHVMHTGLLYANGSTSEHIAFNVTDQMKPYSKLLVYYFTKDGWNADSLYFTVDTSADVFKNKVDISFDRNSAEPAENVSLQITTDPQSLVNVLAVDQSVLLLATGNDVTQGDVISSLRPDSHQSDNDDSIHNPQGIMQTTGIQILTDVVGFNWARPNYKRQVDCGPLYPDTTPPYPVSTTLPVPMAVTGHTTSTGGLKTVEHTRDFFPETWLWTNITSGQDGLATISATVPDTITSWFATAFSVNSLSGLGIVDSAAKFTTFRPFFIHMNLPYSVIRGEQIVLQINVFNYMGQDLDVKVTLERSTDFDVMLNSSGHLTFINEDVVRPITIKAGVAESVFIPIVARTVGSIELSVKAQSTMSADGVKRQLKVEAEGSPMHFNVPLLLSANNPTDVALGFPDNFVADSQKVQVSAIGDIMGPTMKNLKQLLRLPTGCGEQCITNFAPDVFVYNYLESTNQLTSEIAELAIRYMTQGYQRELTFQRNDGSFSVWGPSDREGSMWLTAFVLKSFHQAKQHIFVADNVLTRAASWMGNYQNYDGSFQNKGYTHATKVNGGNSQNSITAFVLIALMESESTLRQHDSSILNKAVRARSFLESHVQNMTDTYDLAITAYALAKAGSTQAFLAYSKLDGKATTTPDGRKYWRVAAPMPMPYTWESIYGNGDSPLMVEISAYALLYLTETRQLSEGLPILKWLVTKRNSLGGFISSQDTVLGLQALSEFGKATSADLDLTVNVDGINFHQSIQITQKDAMVLKLVDMPLSSISTPSLHGVTKPSTGGTTLSPPTPSSVALEAQGHGSALVQVSVSFNVESEPSLPAFNLTANVTYESLHSIVLKACAKYEYSFYHGPGMAVMEIDLPTGFEPDLESAYSDLLYVKKSEIRNKKTIVLYYDEILPSVPTCAYIEMLRSDLVANTKPAAVRVYDYYEPAMYKALTFYQSNILKDSTFCDICNDCGC